MVRFRAAVAVAVVASVLSGCGGGGGDGSPGGKPLALRLGYFPNVTHATAMAGIKTGILGDALGAGIKLEPEPFSAGPEAVEAIFAGAIDASFVGPNPAINAFAKSGGKAIRIVAGATSGGAAFVVQPGIGSASDLRGKTVASPQLGNTQDVALRSWLSGQGLRVTTSGRGDVEVAPQENADTLSTFKAGDIAGAWVPEPWATRLVQEAGGKVLVDERELWPGGQFVTTHLMVATEFLKDHPDAVRRLVEGHVRATEYVTARPSEAQEVANEGIEEVSGKRLPNRVLEAAWGNLTFTVDPVASSLAKSAADAHKVRLLERVDLNGIYELSFLNQALAGAGKREVAGL